MTLTELKKILHESEKVRFIRYYTDSNGKIGSKLLRSVNPIHVLKLIQAIEVMREALDKIANTQDVAPKDSEYSGPCRISLIETRNRRILEARDGLAQADKILEVV